MVKLKDLEDENEFAISQSEFDFAKQWHRIRISKEIFEIFEFFSNSYLVASLLINIFLPSKWIA